MQTVVQNAILNRREDLFEAQQKAIKEKFYIEELLNSNISQELREYLEFQLEGTYEVLAELFEKMEARCP